MAVASELEIPLLINGQNTASDKYFEVHDPGRLFERVARVAIAGEKETNAAVEAAAGAAKNWRATSADARAAMLMEAAKALEEHADELAEVLSREQGMLLRETRRDVANGPKALRDSASIGPAFLEPEIHEDEQSWISIEKEPCGVVGAIVPWNAPIGLAMGRIGPALITGNTVVLKTSPFAPVGLSRAIGYIAEVLPQGVINLLNGDPAGPLLVSHPNVRKVSFTGSIRTGRAVMRKSADTIKRIDMELGGNDPAIVFEDAEISEVVPKIVSSSFGRSGQVCYAIKRVYVPRMQYENYREAFRAALEDFRVGHGLDERATLGPLNNKNQYDYVKALAERARKAGATVDSLGQALDSSQWENGYYLLPMLVSDVEPDAEVVITEQFGPLLPLIAYDDVSNALEMANNTEYGLASSVWSSNTERAVEIARELKAGTTFINSHQRTPLGARVMPFGGFKQSGIGRTRTSVGLAEYVEHHSISVSKRTR